MAKRMTKKKKVLGGYSSPRWSGEICDCSMPLTFDQYDHCAFNCLYCFSWFQKSLKAFNPLYPNQDKNYQSMKLRSVHPEGLRKLFDLELKEGAGKGQFNEYIRQRIPMQWGGLADPFDPYERKHGVGLECLKVLKDHDYPLCFSTKATWWLEDKRYTDLFRGQKNWNVKVSIINLDKEKASQMEKGCPSPLQRLRAVEKIADLNCGGVTLRLRPFIVGFSDKDNEHLKLIKLAGKAGATAMSTEFFCLEGRAHRGTIARYEEMSKIVGFDIHEFYRRNSPKQSGYLRLNWKIKEPYVLEMKEAADKAGMRFYVSDAHWKDQCHNGSCCGLSKDWNYARGQYTEILCKAKKRSSGIVTWDKDMEPYVQMYKKFLYRYAEGFNTIGTKCRTSKWKHTMYDWLKEIWNNPKDGKSPYRYFQGLLRPIDVDDKGNIRYKYYEYKG